ncbi:MAG: GMP synthase subunit A [Candidatus Dadabacteria bacterium]|nr:GMP synthase subunit A [Candidatus Dadabacteria bacterium]
MKVIVIDNGGQWTHREWRVLKYLETDAKIMPNTTPPEELDADALVLSGGAPRIGTEAMKLGRTAEYIERCSTPILGICVGCQFIAIHLGGKAGPADIPEFGRTELNVEAEGALFKGLPKKLVVWESHNDEVKLPLPADLRLLAWSESCAVQAFEHKKRPLFGVQFHPEVEHTEHGYDIFKNFLATARR